MQNINCVQQRDGRCQQEVIKDVEDTEEGHIVIGGYINAETGECGARTKSLQDEMKTTVSKDKTLNEETQISLEIIKASGYHKKGNEEAELIYVKRNGTSVYPLSIMLQ